ncbi:hypothetical protein [Roseomonas sp. 18066]|uniref:hypothetical protein n=1 Tax=Roseomonas sp. 18066 TaxID=2681412 RepID=UPI00135986F2|nr:hypothetical protein [Roseomonas sp. 18066]
MATARFAYRYSDVSGSVSPDESGYSYSFTFTPPVEPGAELMIESSQGHGFLATFLGRTGQGDPVFESDSGIKVLYSDAVLDEFDPFPAFTPAPLGEG